ncbi:MAG: cation diffusion facilitator family transporter [Chloroflexota bacterium]
MLDRKKLTRFAWLSIGTAVLTIFLKTTAYWLTGSVGLLSDALESGINLAAAVMALITLTIAAQPPDADHTYGHDKAEYFAGGVVGALVVVAAVTIGITAVRSLFDPQPLEQIGLGLAISLLAALCNFITARVLLQAGEQHDSMTLMADGRHLMADVWTSGAVVVGIGGVALTGWFIFDPLIALVVAVHILRSGLRLVSQAVGGLMDESLPAHELARVENVLNSYRDEGIAYHALRSRRSGARRFVSVHIQVPGAWTVQKGHTLLETLEADLRRELPALSVFTHLEPLEDPASWQDIPLHREK